MLVGDRWRVPARGSRVDRTSWPSLKRGTEQDGTGKTLDMRIQLESACEVAGRILEGEFINGVLSFCDVSSFAQTDEFAIC
jgi:hypothetical protein